MARCQFDSRVDEIVSNLLALYAKRTPADESLGTAWYPKAHKIVCEWADHYSYSMATVACTIAALSPQTEWSRNLIVADDLLADRYPSIGGILGENIRKAKLVLSSRASNLLAIFPSGPKVNSFAANLAGDFSLVTIDAHVMQAALADVQATYTLKWAPYAVFARCYQDAAKTVDLEPAVFQAIIWHVWKRMYPQGSKQKLRQQWYVTGEF